jgi:hypothetical protein
VAGVAGTADPGGDRVTGETPRSHACVADPVGEVANEPGSDEIRSDPEGDPVSESAWDRAPMLFSPKNSKEL